MLIQNVKILYYQHILRLSLVGMGIRESDGELKAKMDAAIASMKADGTLSDLIAKWFDGRMVKF